MSKFSCFFFNLILTFYVVLFIFLKYILETQMGEMKFNKVECFNDISEENIIILEA